MARRQGPRPRRLRIRGYKVGFGDCFLLTFDYRTGRRPPRPHRLRHPRRAGAQGHASRPYEWRRTSPRVTEREAPRRGRHTPARRSHQRLRHRAKGKGRATSSASARATPRHPAVDRGSRRSRRRRRDRRQRRGRRALAFAATRSLEAMHEVAAIIARRPATIDMSDVEAEAQRAAPSPIRPTSCRPRLSPRSRRLAGRRGPARDAALPGRDEPEEPRGGQEPHDHVHASRSGATSHFGAAPAWRPCCPGSSVDVLGPPTVEQSAEILKERRVDQTEFWMLRRRRHEHVDGREPASLPRREARRRRGGAETRALVHPAGARHPRPSSCWSSSASSTTR